MAALASGAVLLAGAPASAHVTVSPTVTTADSYTVLTVSVPHGCDGSSTTRVAIQIPDLINSVTPTINQGWTVEKVMADLDPPVTDSHGNELTERVAEVVYTAKTPLPDDMRDVFELSLKLPDAAGEELIFPAIQTCEQGEAAWAQVPADGQDSHELDYPAPSFVITAADDDSAGGGHAADDAADEAADDAADDAAGSTELTPASSTTDTGPSSLLGWIGLFLGLLGFIAGALALHRTRKAA
ncbi:YcnI family protein [Solwaraspora sp. WMMD406]|uniref:YcnI family copper-binding membrane protein n=1 Tax=Solwaraspora sp. WMMD406 TaxID=3016095 RepID=UPI00241777DD|nr:YcnI family protein [Solwaraspora sp. WMMD406]MDG4767678.1 YcnI family protein [Solwaraspora sp. WMMD406]